MQSALTAQANEYRYLNKPFTGIAYVRNSPSSFHAVLVTDGEIKQDFISPYCPAAFSSDMIDISGNTEDDFDEDDLDDQPMSGLCYERHGFSMRLLRAGEPYTGLALVFFGPFCVREIGYQDGFIFSDAQYDQNGQIINLALEKNLAPENTLDENYAWFPDGTLKGAWISLTETFPDRSAQRLARLALSFKPGGKLSSINVDGTVAAVDKILSETPYFPVKKLSEVSGYAASEDFKFFDDAVPYALFAEMAERNAFASTIALQIPTRFVQGAEGVGRLSHLRALRKLTLCNVDGTEIDKARQVQQRRPDLEIQVQRPSVDYPGVLEYFVFAG